MGHGEWSLPEEYKDIEETAHSHSVDRDPEWIYKWRCKVDKDIQLHQEVMDKGYPNIWVPGGQSGPSGTWTSLKNFLKDYDDKQMVEWIRYGWPTGRLPTLPEPKKCNKNHKGAMGHPQALQKYIRKEVEHGAIMGPYNKIPFISVWAYLHSVLDQRRIQRSDVSSMT